MGSNLALLVGGRGKMTLNTILLYGIATPAAASPVVPASRSSPSPTSRSTPTFDSEFLFPPKFTSLYPRIHEEGRTNEKQCHESHLTRARGRGFPRVTSNAVMFLLLAHLSLRTPRYRVGAVCTLLASRDPEPELGSSEMQSWTTAGAARAARSNRSPAQGCRASIPTTPRLPARSRPARLPQPAANTPIRGGSLIQARNASRRRDGGVPSHA